MSGRDDDHGEADECRTLVDAVPNGILALFDTELRFRIVGPATLPISGEDASTKVGRSVDDLYPDAVAAQLEPVFEATLDGVPQSHEVVYLDRVHRVETAPASVAGEPRGVVLTQDVTAERHQSDGLTRRREELGMFASVVSHDLRNPPLGRPGRSRLRSHDRRRRRGNRPGVPRRRGSGRIHDPPEGDGVRSAHHP